jgi:hypothetical protein
MKFFLFLFTTLVYSKLCIHCKHFRPVTNPFLLFDQKFGKCSAFPIVYDDDYVLVTGKKTKKLDYHYCRTARNSEYLCGMEGTRFTTSKDQKNHLPN